MNKLFCDLCKKEVEGLELLGYASNSSFLSIWAWLLLNNYYVCNDCKKEIEKVINKKVKELKVRK